MMPRLSLSRVPSEELLREFGRRVRRVMRAHNDIDGLYDMYARLLERVEPALGRTIDRLDPRGSHRKPT